MQSRLDSLVEALINVVIGYGISFMANATLLPMVGLPVTIRQNLLIGLGMTVVSVARQYTIRRWAQVRLTAFRKRIVEFLVGRGLHG